MWPTGRAWCCVGFSGKSKATTTSTEHSRHRKWSPWRSSAARVAMPTITHTQAPNAAMRHQATSIQGISGGAASICPTKRRRYRLRNMVAGELPPVGDTEFDLSNMHRDVGGAYGRRKQLGVVLFFRKAKISNHVNRTQPTSKGASLEIICGACRDACPPPRQVAEHVDAAPSHFKPYNLKWRIWRYAIGIIGSGPATTCFVCIQPAIRAQTA